MVRSSDADIRAHSKIAADLQGRLIGLRVVADRRASRVLAVAFWVLQVVQHAKYEELGRQQLSRGRFRCARRAACCSIATAACSSRTATRSRSRSSASRRANLDETIAPPGRGDRRGRERDPRASCSARNGAIRCSGRSRSIEHATFAQVAAVTARQLELPEVDVQQVPTRDLSDDGWRRTCSATSARSRRRSSTAPEFARSRSRRDHRPGRRRDGLQRAASWASDGNRIVVVNSVGREIEELGKEDPRRRRSACSSRSTTTCRTRSRTRFTRGRLRRRRGVPRSAHRRDPRDDEPAGVRPERLRRRHRRRDVVAADHRSAEADDESADSGHVLAGSTFKIVMAIAALERRRHHAGLQVLSVPGSATFYGRTFQCDKKGGHGSLDLRHAIEQSCNVYFYNVGEHARSIDTIHKYAAHARSGRARPASICRAKWTSLVPSTEWKQRDVQGAVVPGRDDFRRDRPGRRLRHADRAGDDDLDGRQRRHARHAARRARAFDEATARAGSRSPPPAPRSRLDDHARASCRPCATGSGSSSTAPAPAAARGSTGHDVVGQDRHGAGRLAQNEGARPRRRRHGHARPRLVRVLRAARQPADRRRRLRRARRARRRDGRADRQATCSRRSSRSRTGRPLPVPPTPVVATGRRRRRPQAAGPPRRRPPSAPEREARR